MTWTVLGYAAAAAVVIGGVAGARRLDGAARWIGLLVAIGVAVVVGWFSWLAGILGLGAGGRIGSIDPHRARW